MKARRMTRPDVVPCFPCQEICGVHRSACWRIARDARSLPRLDGQAVAAEDARALTASQWVAEKAAVAEEAALGTKRARSAIR